MLALSVLTSDLIELSPTPPPGVTSFSDFTAGEPHNPFSVSYLESLLVSDAVQVKIAPNLPPKSVTLVGWLPVSDEAFEIDLDTQIPVQDDLRPLVQAMPSQYNLGHRYVCLSFAGEPLRMPFLKTCGSWYHFGFYRTRSSGWVCHYQLLVSG